MPASRHIDKGDSIRMPDFANWRAQRNAEMKAPDGWLGLVGLFWLQPGTNLVGSAEDAVVRLPGGPAQLGDLCWQADGVTWQPRVGQAQSLQTDHQGSPTTVDCGNLSFFVVDRDGQLAVRVRDRDWAASKRVASLSYFDYAPDWCITADWQVLSPVVSMEVPNVSGDLKRVEVGFKAVFSVGGQDFELRPMSVSEKEIFFVFRDRTSGKETYGAGRFLKVLPAVDGKITLDFNFAYNPPCAFTPFATCPLPPPENWLPFAVPAGEKTWMAGS